MSSPIEMLEATVRTQAGTAWAYLKTNNAVYDRCVTRVNPSNLDVWSVGWCTVRDPETKKSVRIRELKYDVIDIGDVVEHREYQKERGSVNV